MDKNEVKRVIAEMIKEQEINFSFSYDNYEHRLELTIGVEYPTEDGYTECITVEVDSIRL